MRLVEWEGPGEVTALGLKFRVITRLKESGGAFLEEMLLRGNKQPPACVFPQLFLFLRHKQPRGSRSPEL